MADEVVLSQDDIDAMVSRAAKEQVAAPPVQSVPHEKTVEERKIEKNNESVSAPKPALSIAERPSQAARPLNPPPAVRQVVPDPKVIVKALQPKEVKTVVPRVSQSRRRYPPPRTVRRMQVHKVIPPPMAMQSAMPNEVMLLRAAVNDLTNRLTRMEIALTEAQKTAANSSINKMFQCDSCGSKEFVSFNVKCTKCGKQSWWGWWPLKR